MAPRKVGTSPVGRGEAFEVDQRGGADIDSVLLRRGVAGHDAIEEAGILDVPPLVDAVAKFVNDRRRVVLLFAGRYASAFIEYNLLLFCSALSLPGLWDWGDELGRSA